jgi:hypothetical protein
MSRGVAGRERKRRRMGRDPAGVDGTPAHRYPVAPGGEWFDPKEAFSPGIQGGSRALAPWTGTSHPAPRTRPHDHRRRNTAMGEIRSIVEVKRMTNVCAAAPRAPTDRNHPPIAAARAPFPWRGRSGRRAHGSVGRGGAARQGGPLPRLPLGPVIDGAPPSREPRTRVPGARSAVVPR